MAAARSAQVGRVAGAHLVELAVAAQPPAARPAAQPVPVVGPVARLVAGLVIAAQAPAGHLLAESAPGHLIAGLAVVGLAPATPLAVGPVAAVPVRPAHQVVVAPVLAVVHLASGLAALCPWSRLPALSVAYLGRLPAPPPILPLFVVLAPTV